MKYLAIMHEFYECDNNTPSDKFWAKVVEFESDEEKEKAEDKYLEQYKEDEACEATIEFIPLEKFNEWVKVGEIW